MPAQPRSRLALAAWCLFVLHVGTSCTNPFSVTILSPEHGSFTTAASVTITGKVDGVSVAADAVVTVNGVPVVVQTDKTWSTVQPLDANQVFNAFLVEATNLRTNVTLRDRLVVIAGESVADGDFSLDSLGLRLNDTGLDAVEPLVSSLVDLDIATLLPVNTLVINDYCAIDSIFGCLGSVDARIATPAPSFTQPFGLEIDSMTNFVAGDVTINNIEVNLNIIGSGLAPSCGLRIRAVQTLIIGDYGLSPAASDPTQVDVNLIGAPGVSFTGFSHQFTSGLCDFPLIGDLIQLIIGDVQPIVLNGLVDFLRDPDGGGPADAPIAEAIEVALAGVQIAGPIGEGLGLELEAPLFAVLEDNAGLTLASDARITSTPCTPPEGAPDLTASLHVDEPFPTFGATTPGGLPYGLGISISTSAFNQLLKAEVECGLLQETLTEIDLGTGPLPLTAGVLSLFIPELASADPMRAFVIKLRPTLAPALTGNPGPLGELAELRVGGLSVEVRDTVLDAVVIGGQVDFRAGLDFAFDNQTSELVPSIGLVVAADIDVDIVNNTVMTNANQLAAVLEFLLPAVLPTLGASLGSFPLPQFLGLSLQGVSVEENGEFLSLFADLVVAP